MNEKVKQNQLRLFNKLFSTLPTVKKLNNIENELKLKEPISHIYYFHSKDFWFSKGETEEKYVYIFGPKNKAIHEITAQDATLIVDFDKNKQFNDNSLGMFSIKHSEIHIVLNYAILNKRYPYLNIDNLKITRVKSIDNSLKLNVLDLGSLNNDFIENLENLLLKSENNLPNNKSQPFMSSENCEICLEKKKDIKIDSQINNLKNLRPELCGNCIEKILTAEFYNKVKSLIKGNDTKILDTAKEKFANDQLFDYGMKLLEKYEIINYIGVKRLYFSINTDSFIVSEYSAYSDENNLLLDNVFQAKKSKKSKKKKIEIKNTTLTHETTNKMNTFIDELKKGTDFENALIKSNLTENQVKAWYNLGKKNYEDYKNFYNVIRMLVPDNILEKNNKIISNKELINEFITLINDGKTNEEAIEQLKIPKFKVKNWIKEGETGNEKYIDFYNAYMMQNINETKKPTISKELIANNEIIFPDSKLCKICGKSLNRNSPNDICKRCSRKQYASKILIKLLESIEPGITFKKEDLKVLGLQSLQIQDYIWTLQEFNLIFSENNKFKLKDKSILDKFIEQSGIKIEDISSNEEKIKLNKTCKTCGKNLEISRFSKSKNTTDGYDDNCKECRKLIITASYLKEIIRIVNPGDNFNEDDLKPHFQNQMQIKGKIWALIDNDLVNTNFEENNYVLANEKVINEFLDKYYEEKDNTHNINETLNNQINLKETTKQEQMDFIIKAISEGKSRKEAAKLAQIALYKITHWYNEGRQGFGKDNITFYNTLKNLEQSNENENKRIKNKMKNILEKLENGTTLSHSEELEINQWLEKGKQNIKPFSTFYNEYMNISPKDEEKKSKIPQIKKSDQFGTSLSITQMNVILEKLATGMSEKEAVENAQISFNTYKYWLNRGKQEFGELYTQFYYYVNQIKNNEYQSTQSTDDEKILLDTIPSTIDPDIYAPLSKEKENTFKGRSSRTGIAWVNKVGNKWVYSTTINKQPIRMNSENIYELHRKVKNKNYDWGIRDYEKASKIIKIPKEFTIPKKPISNEIKNDEISQEIYAPLPKEYLETFPKQSNQTGIAWVNKIGNNFIYSRKVNGKTIKITDSNIEKLHEKVLKENQIWGIRNYTNAKKFINIPDDFKISEINENKEKISTEIQEVNNDIYSPLSKEYLSKFNPNPNNKTGIAWVNRVGNNWIYQRQRNGKIIRIIDSDIHELHKKVINNNQIWGITDIDKAKPIIESKKLIFEEPAKITTPEAISNEITINYMTKKNNLYDILIKGMIRNNEFIKVLNKLDSFEKNFKRIISTSVDDKLDLFIELELNENLIDTFEKRIKELGWKIDK